jgi:nitronate monooxygenase
MQGKELLEFPLQNTLTAALRQWASHHENPEFQSVWAGTGYRDIRPLPAAQLMQVLDHELNAAQS